MFTRSKFRSVDEGDGPVKPLRFECSQEHYAFAMTLADNTTKHLRKKINIYCEEQSQTHQNSEKSFHKSFSEPCPKFETVHSSTCPENDFGCSVVSSLNRLSRDSPREPSEKLVVLTY